jgi:hypothetical protein
MRQETVRGRAGMPSTSAIGKLVEAVDVHGVARRRSPGEQARRHRRGRAWPVVIALKKRLFLNGHPLEEIRIMWGVSRLHTDKADTQHLWLLLRACR